MSETSSDAGSASPIQLDPKSLQQTLSSSSTTKRIAQLHTIGDVLAQETAPSSVSLGLAKLLFSTHAYYQDRGSRLAVRKCLAVVIEQAEDPAVLSWLVNSIQQETQKPGVARSTTFVLLEWCVLLVQQTIGSPQWQKLGPNIVLAAAEALEKCLQPSSRRSLQQSALVISRRAIRRLFAQTQSSGTGALEAVSLLTSSGSHTSFKNAPFLGIIADVAARQPEWKALLATVNSKYFDFYIRELIASKVTIPSHIGKALSGFFRHFTTLAEIEGQLIPSIEKGLLRAPEIILGGILQPLVVAVPSNFDFSAILSQRLLVPILSNAKSGNPEIRNAALGAFQAIVTRCSDLGKLDGVADEVATALKSGKLSSPDHRMLYAKLLAATPLSKKSAEVSSLALAAVALKEGNELALGAETAALTQVVRHMLSHDQPLPKAVLDSVIKGLSDKKAASRRFWLLLVGASLQDCQLGDIQEGMMQFIEATVPKLIETFNEVIANPGSTAQSGLIVGAYILTSLAPAIQGRFSKTKAAAVLEKLGVSKVATDLNAKQPYLLNPRIYSKIAANEDFPWLCLALATVGKSLRSECEQSLRLAWANAIIHILVSHLASLTMHREAVKVVKLLYEDSPDQNGRFLIEGLWDCFSRQRIKERDSKLDTADLIHVLNVLCPDVRADETQERVVPVDILERHACALVVLARPELIRRSSWIELCLRMGIDPGQLAGKYTQELLKELSLRTSSNEQLETINEAAYNASAELAFVAPSVIIPRLLEMMQHDLDVAQLQGIGPVEAAISRTGEGSCFVDVLGKAAQNKIPSKNTKDYDILKWEEEIRSQVEKKKGERRKLTAEETAKVNAQMKKESAIRQNVHRVQAKLSRGMGVIRSLATGPPTDASLWLGTAVRLLLSILNNGATLVTGDSASATYVTCSNKVNSRLGTTRSAIAVATLRLRDVILPPEYNQEGLENLVTRVLYRLRFASEQRPFDVDSLIYILPLLFDVLEKGGIGADADDRDAQTVLAIEVISFHTGICAEESIPRTELLAAVISAMQRYTQHYKLIKDCFTDLCRCVAPNMSSNEIHVLEEGSIVPQIPVRTTILQSISADVDMSDFSQSSEIWLACHDDVEENREIGREIWEESDFSVTDETPIQMVAFAANVDIQLRRAAARSLAEAAAAHNEALTTVLPQLQKAYKELAKPKTQQLDEFGIPKKMDLSDPWEARHGIALCYKELAQVFNPEQVDVLFDFMITDGPLGDKDDTVRSEMLDAALRSIETHGAGMVVQLMKKFERNLQMPDRGDQTADRVNEAVVIMYGALARHLESGNPTIPAVIDRLLATLGTPSETVQFAIAECLPPLIRACPDKASAYYSQVMEELLDSKKYASQRGAAYGLAGLTMGRGIVSLREFRIISTLKTALENKKEARHREAGLLGFELLAAILGRLFEPYVIQIVPQLLTGFGDSNADVRDASLAAAKACFGQLSSYGVKRLMPTLLNGLEDDQWRSKRGACDLLGAMAYLDPEQLANSLPEIIPPLTGVLNDSHKEVRAAANRSLKRFGEVITNPEIKNLVSVLLKALSDPTKFTEEALDALIKVQFVHFLDAPSLALITRILERGLGDRSGTKRKAAQVIGSLAHLTERKDILTHLPVLVAGLKTAAVDPVPTTRATASRALGSLVEKLGEESLPDLIPGLMQTLKSDTGAGDRLGSAQALSEVLAGLGTARLEETLPTILQNVESSKPAVREGFMALFIFLPVCFGNSFSNYLGRIVPPILSGLADDIESIRDTALRAGRLLVKNFAVRAVDLLLPELERGLADDNYRIRLSSVELVGDLLFNLTGVSAKDDDANEDYEEMAKEAGASLIEVLGMEKRNKILSALYVCRSDTAGAVRSAAISVWKVLVHGPKILKELVPNLTQLLIRRLGSSNMEHKVIASNALGELIRKAGDGVLASLLPTLEEGLQISTDSDSKQGICLALRELISSAAPEALEDHEKTLISVVRTALTDSDEEVRSAAAEAFDSLQQILGKRAVDQVLPYLLNLLRSEDEAQNALSALLTLLTETTRSNIILPNLIPTLITPPITSFDAKALASLSKVAGAAMNRRLPGIINSLLDNEINCKDEELQTELSDSFDIVMQSIDEFDGLNIVMNVLLGLLKNEDHRKRAATAKHMGNFFVSSGIDYARYNQDIIRSLLNSFDDGDLDVVKAAWVSLAEFTKRLRKEEMESLVVSTRQTLQRVGVGGSNLRGFELPKGISAILPIFLQGLMNGTADQRVHAALGISDLVDRTSEASLKPFVTQITGPLIRVVSERATEVKSAILLTLNNLLEKMPTALKPFLPQLQRTFAKSLADTSSEVLRSRAAKALGTLIKYTPRIDPLIAELATGSKTADAGVRTAMLKALYEVISKAGANMGEASRNTVLTLIDTETNEQDINMTITHTKLLGALLKNVPEESVNALLKSRVITTQFSVSSALAFNAVLVESPSTLLSSPFADDLPDLLCLGMTNKNTYIADNYILATGKILLSSPPKNFDDSKKLFEALANIVQPGNPADSRRLALVVIRTLSRTNMEIVRAHVPVLAAPVFSSVRDPVIPVKLSAEAAFVELFSVADEESRIFDKFMAGPGNELPPTTKRSMGDYFKRVALRLGTQARERREAEGGQGGLGLSNDEAEDEKEIWSVGKTDTSAEEFT